MTSTSSNSSKLLFETSATRACYESLELIISPRRTMVVFGTIFGSPGLGKISAVDLLISSTPPHPHTKRSPFAKAAADYNSTPISLTKALLTHILGKPMNQKAMQAVKKYDVQSLTDHLIAKSIQCVFIDRGHWLSDQCLKFCYNVALVTQIPFIFIGESSLPLTLSTYPEIHDRTIPIEFQELGEQEILETFLPNIKIMDWYFDATNSEHIAQGKRLWKAVKPSLLKLIVGIETGLIEIERRRQKARADGREITVSLKDIVDVAIDKAPKKNTRKESKTAQTSATLPDDLAKKLSRHELEAIARWARKHYKDE